MSNTIFKDCCTACSMFLMNSLRKKLGTVIEEKFSNFLAIKALRGKTFKAIP